MSTAVAQVGTQAENTETLAKKREAPRIPSESMALQAEGTLWREWLVRAPVGLIAQDLNDAPEIWRNVQANPHTALQRLDKVTILAADQSWLVNSAVVTESTNTAVILAIGPGALVRMRGMNGTWQDDRHLIRWSGAGFTCHRKSDDVQIVVGQFRTMEAAKTTLFAQHYTQRGA